VRSLPNGWLRVSVSCGPWSLVAHARPNDHGRPGTVALSHPAILMPEILRSARWTPNGSGATPSDWGRRETSVGSADRKISCLVIIPSLNATVPVKSTTTAAMAPLLQVGGAANPVVDAPGKHVVRRDH
jgi:hypothetical protein